MNIEQWPLDRIIPYARNPRDNRLAVAAVKASIKEFGFRQPIVVDKEGVIVAGDTRYQAAQQLGLDSVPVHVATELTPIQIKAYRLADNRTADNATWDDDLLKLELQELQEEDFDLDLTGFNDEDLGRLIDQSLDTSDVDAEPQIDKAEELREKWGVTSGQLWQLGDHRLICGDCIDPAVVERVMDGEKAELLFTSPPYWVGKEYEREETWDQVQEFISKASAIFASVTIHRIVINTGIVQASALTGERAHVRLLIDNWQTELYKYKFLLRYVRIWAKRGGLVHTAPISDCIDQHWEFIGVFYRPETYEGQRRLEKSWATDGVWDDIQGTATANGHVAAFPIEMPSRNIQLYTDKNAVVFEPFAGSGTTIIACERLDRKCRAIEIDPGYCAIAIQRFFDATGIEPKLLSG